MRKLLLSHSSGSSAEIYLNGAQVTSWIPAMERERLFLSRNAVLEPGKSIRGGIPVVFPQFADSGPLPKHGWLRTTEWAVEEEEPAVVTLRTEETRQSQAIWPHTYEARLHVSLEENALQVTLEVRNPGGEPFTFTGALHSYLAVDDISKASILGLYGLPYIDKTANRAVVHDEQEAVTIDGEADRIYTSAPRMVELSEGTRSLRVSMTGFPDIVIWNPGSDLAREIADMQPHDYARFICIEAAVANQPIVLRPGESWEGTQRLEATR